MDIFSVFQVNLAVTMWTVYLTTGFEIRRGDLVRRHNTTLAKYQVKTQPHDQANRQTLPTSQLDKQALGVSAILQPFLAHHN